MAYTNLYQKLANAWGCGCESNTEYGALEALVNNPPFGVKTELVEVIPETIVNSYSADGASYYATIGNYTLEIGKTYVVKLNGTAHELVCVNDNGNGQLGAPYGNYADFPFSVYSFGSNLTLVKANNSSATISICEKKVTVKELDAKFRGFGETTGIGVILPEIYSNTMNDGAFEFPALNDELINGSKCNINYNGKSYECSVFAEDNIWVTGNLSIISEEFEDTGEPFVIQNIPEVALLVIPLDEATAVTVSITGEKTIVTPIPQKYLPEPVVFTIGENDVVCNKSFSECLELVKKGTPAQLYVDGMLVQTIQIVPSSEAIIFVFYIMEFSDDGSHSATPIPITYIADGTITTEI